MRAGRYKRRHGIMPLRISSARQEVRMSQRMRTRTVLAGMVLLGILAGTTQAQGPTPPAPAASAKPVAVVDGEIITMADLDSVLKARGPTPVSLSDHQRRQLQMETLAMMIDDILLQKFLR